MTASVPAKPIQRSFMDKLLDGVERVGNKVPHPVLMFAYLILLIIVVSSILGWLGVSVTEEIAVPLAVPVMPNYYEDLSQPSVGLPPVAEVTDYEIQKTTIAIRPILSVEGIRWMFTSFVPTFQGFGALAITLIALLGAGAAEQGGLMAALIRKIVKVAPAALLAFLIVFVGALSSVASDAGYLILIPLGAVAFLAVGRHPIAGLAAGFAGVAAIFMANLIVTPTDAMLFEITNESLALIGQTPISITADYFFQIVSTIVMTIVAGFITVKVVEPRLGKYNPMDAGEAGPVVAEEVDPALDSRGLRNAGLALLGVLAVVALCTLPPGAPLRDPQTGDIIGQTPFMASLLFIIMLCFLIPGIAYGAAVGKYKHANDVIGAIVKTFAGLGGLILTLLMISQFIAYFNYSQIPNVIAVALADGLSSRRHRRDPAADRLCPGDRRARPDHARLARQVGHLCADLRAALRASRRARADALRRLPRGRLAHEHADAADGLLPRHRHVRAAVRQEVRRGQPRRAHDAVRGRHADRLGDPAAAVVHPGHPARAGVSGPALAK